MAKKQKIRGKGNYIPSNELSHNGELSFPKLRDSTPVLTTIADLKSTRVDLRPTVRQQQFRRVSKSNQRLNQALGANSEFRQVRNNISYKPILDVLGESFPFHPEYLYVIDIVTRYYGVTIIDVLEFIAVKEVLESKKDMGGRNAFAKRTVNMEISACVTMLMYLLYVQYKCNPVTIMRMFGISQPLLRSRLDSFARDYENSPAVRADYLTLHGRLLMLQNTSK